MPPAIDIEAYFARVGHAGPRAATLETARELRLRHVQAIPFETSIPSSLAQCASICRRSSRISSATDERQTTKRTLASVAQVHTVLETDLSSVVPDASGLEAAITRFLHAD